MALTSLLIWVATACLAPSWGSGAGSSPLHNPAWFAASPVTSTQKACFASHVCWIPQESGVGGEWPISWTGGLYLSGWLQQQAAPCQQTWCNRHCDDSAFIRCVKELIWYPFITTSLHDNQHTASACRSLQTHTGLAFEGNFVLTTCTEWCACHVFSCGVHAAGSPQRTLLQRHTPVDPVPRPKEPPVPPDVPRPNDTPDTPGKASLKRAIFRPLYARDKPHSNTLDVWEARGVQVPLQAPATEALTGTPVFFQVRHDYEVPEHLEPLNAAILAVGGSPAIAIDIPHGFLSSDGARYLSRLTPP